MFREEESWDKRRKPSGRYGQKPLSVGNPGVNHSRKSNVSTGEDLSLFSLASTGADPILFNLAGADEDPILSSRVSTKVSTGNELLW